MRQLVGLSTGYGLDPNIAHATTFIVNKSNRSTVGCPADPQPIFDIGGEVHKLYRSTAGEGDDGEFRGATVTGAIEASDLFAIRRDIKHSTSELAQQGWLAAVERYLPKAVLRFEENPSALRGAAWEKALSQHLRPAAFQVRPHNHMSVFAMGMEHDCVPIRTNRRKTLASRVEG
jgi:hypothetical protein